ncbi:MAG: hypothetical protein JNM38_21015 [Acidobacteria bacterium]|nr:hypothetical protein [Acidobacteriota bacterium]
MRLVPFVVAILLWASSLGLAAADRDAADTDAPPWFSAPAEIVGCKAERPPDTRDLVQRYACGDAWVDVFIYDPARLGVTLKPGESTVEAEFRVFLDETAHDLVAQGMYDSMVFDDLRPLCVAVPGGEVQGGLLQGTGVHRGQVRFTAMAIFAVKGMHLKLRASGTRAWLFDPFRFSEALLRSAVTWP